MADDDFAVARHVEVEFEILNAGGDGGGERLERVFGMCAGGTAMAKDARRGGGEEVGVEMLAHFCFSSATRRFLRSNREGDLHLYSIRESRKEQNLESRAKEIARCKRTLTFILSHSRRGDRR